MLKRARGTRGYLYEQPWYVIIGPPGAGKTTALINSGLSFPLAAELGQGGKPGAIAGVGGTRLCEWWFTDEAVLIDTAGRYTTQDSDSAVDRAGWRGFLALLKRSRPRQPLNGVLVAIGLADIMAGRAEMLAHAAAIRARVKELNTALGVRLPIYALFTKADLIAGFTEFFADLDREKRAQVWGDDLPAAARRTSRGRSGASGRPLPGSARAHAALLARVEGRVLDRLQAERSPERRALIAGFPAQVASLADPMGEFLLAAFGGSRLDPAPLLRGIYFTSGTQAGTPIDRLTGAMAQAFGMAAATPAKPDPGARAQLFRDAVAAACGVRRGHAGRRATRRRAQSPAAARRGLCRDGAGDDRRLGRHVAAARTLGAGGIGPASGSRSPTTRGMRRPSRSTRWRMR